MLYSTNLIKDGKNVTVDFGLREKIEIFQKLHFAKILSIFK